ncbi:MAG TPA: SelT/SelW/SelH family protein [Gammaproteobacteria bacterium]|nr:SelT/SelW/SelH family protein [Gammaproteobacteria bacterium]
MDTKPDVEIEYCTGCRWMLRAAWFAQELLSTFESELGSVSLKPGSDAIFEIRVDGKRVWSRKADGGFPDIKLLKQRVRDCVAPGRDLGHLEP